MPNTDKRVAAQQIAPESDEPGTPSQSAAVSKLQSGRAAPQGSVFDFTLDDSVIFPGTTRTISIYVPAQYRADKPACVFVCLDGLLLELPAAFDRLIDKQQMPVTIAIGVSPGIVVAASSPDNPRYNRSTEFDGLNAGLACFLIEEILPAVEQRQAPDGRAIRLSKDPNDRGIGGVSTGGIAAFTVAWERPDQFSRVFTAIGTFVGMRGGDRYPVIVRKTEPKAIRVFMQDGANDQWLAGPEVGDWWMGNQSMQRALEFAGYEVEHVWGDGAHDMDHAKAIFPDAMRWLWKDWPQRIRAGVSRNTFLSSILRADENWQVVSGGYRSAQVLTADPVGTVVLRDVIGARTWKIHRDGTTTADATIVAACSSIAHDGQGRCYVADVEQARIIAYEMDGSSQVVASHIRALCVVSTRDGTLYVTEHSGEDAGKIWIVRPNGDKAVLDRGLRRPTAVALSPDGLWLAVAERESHCGYSYRVHNDGTLQAKQRFYWFHVPDDADDSGVDGWVVDREGRLYAATRMGVQIFDRNGRVRAILPVPGGAATGVSFGGADFSTLYVSSADQRIYGRRLLTAGVPPGAAPIQLPPWTAG